MKRVRFSILTVLVVGTLFSIGVSILSPPRVSFGPPAFTAFPAFGTHWGDLPATVIARVKVKNEGLLPIWYREVSPDGFALGSLASTSSFCSRSQFKISWRSLASGEQIELREYGLEPKDEISILFSDWTGRRANVICKGIDIKSIWEHRHSLPSERE